MSLDLGEYVPFGAYSPPWHSIIYVSETSKLDMEWETTWAHVINTTSAKFITFLIRCSETEVGDGNSKAIIKAKDVLWLQVPMIDTESMAIFNCIEQLEKDVLDEPVVPKIAAAMQDLGKQIVVRCIVHDDVSVVELFNDTMKGDHARMG